MPQELARQDADEKRAPTTPIVAAAIDPRILQANERTLLAWVRTAVGLMAFGFVIARVGLWLREVNPAEARGASRSVALGALVIAFAAATSIGAVVRFRTLRARYLRGDLSPAGHGMETAVAVGVAVLGVILCAVLVLR